MFAEWDLYNRRDVDNIFLMAYVQSTSYIYVSAGGIYMICKICICSPGGICMICVICTCSAKWGLYDLHTFARWDLHDLQDLHDLKILRKVGSV